MHFQIAQWHGLFSANEDHIVGEVLEAIVDEEARWHAWSRIECVKRYVKVNLDVGGADECAD